MKVKIIKTATTNPASVRVLAETLEELHEMNDVYKMSQVIDNEKTMFTTVVYKKKHYHA